MVAFTCNACGESVKKNRVEKHQLQCVACSSLSCIDCGVTFYGQSYVKHTQCISEAEKYHGKFFQQKDKRNKGEKKQQDWINNLRHACSDAKFKNINNTIIEKIVSFDNIPRKRTKFMNFMKNSVKVYKEELLDAIWEIFSASLKCTSDSVASSNVENINTQSSKQAANERLEESSTSAAMKCKKTNIENTGTELGKRALGERTKKDTSTTTKYKKTKKEKNLKTVTKASHCDDEGKDTTRIKKSKLEVIDKPKDLMKRKSTNESHNKVKNGKKREKNSLSTDKADKKRKNTKSHEFSTQVLTKNAGSTSANTKFDWKRIIIKIMLEGKKESISVKRLKKRVFAALNESSGDRRIRSAYDRDVMFSKALKKCRQHIKIVGDRVQLINSK